MCISWIRFMGIIKCKKVRTKAVPLNKYSRYQLIRYNINTRSSFAKTKLQLKECCYKCSEYSNLRILPEKFINKDCSISNLASMLMENCKANFNMRITVKKEIHIYNFKNRQIHDDYYQICINIHLDFSYFPLRFTPLATLFLIL